MKISLIAAIDKNRGIGKEGRLPWYLPEDLERFRKLTIGHVIIMGRKTFESIGRPLPHRINIVITHDSALAISGCKIAYSLREAVAMARRQPQGEPGEIFVIGGGQIFSQAIDLADKLYLTIIEGDFGADTFFPDYSDFKKVVREESGQSGEYKYRFLELERQDLRRSDLPENLLAGGS